MFKKDDIDLLSNFIIPSSLDFRIISLKTDYANLLSDVLELGSTAFTKHVLSNIQDEDEKKEFISLVSS